MIQHNWARFIYSNMDVRFEKWGCPYYFYIIKLDIRYET